jgi:hypothetical protein
VLASSACGYPSAVRIALCMLVFTDGSPGYQGDQRHKARSDGTSLDNCD